MFVSIDQRIEDYKLQLHSMEDLSNMSFETIRLVHASYCLASAATIQLHSPFTQSNATSRGKCLGGGYAIVRANAAARASEFPFVNPILAASDKFF